MTTTAKQLVIEIRTVAHPEAQTYVDAQRWEPDATLSRLDSPPKAILDIKTAELREERLAQWTRDQALKLEQSALRKKQTALDKAGLYWWTAKLVAVALVDCGPGRSASYSGDDEKALLTTVFKDLVERWPGHVLIGKSSLEFDFPVLVGRAMANEVGLPGHLRSRFPIRDIHDIFGTRTTGSQRSTIADYAFGLGLEIRREESTISLYQMTQLGNDSAWGQIEDSCMREASLVREMLRRYETPFGHEIKKCDVDIPF